VIGNIGLLTHTFLPAALAAFRELFPLVEVTATEDLSLTLSQLRTPART
jgi:DNA-binding transcriptional LysR family regulator